MTDNFLIRKLARLTLVGCFMVGTGCSDGNIKDEAAWIRDNVGEHALPQNENGTLYPTHPYDAFKGMDSHVTTLYDHEFTDDEIKGRNTWVMWTGGNQAFWDHLARKSNGIVDFLKICDSRFIRRGDRFKIMGVVPNPGMAETNPNGETKDKYGLYIDTYSDTGGAYVSGGPPDPKVYGYGSGIVGLRLFPRESDPDPRVREEWERNKDKWDATRYLKNEEYYKDPDLIRPYRVGMSCGFCHIQANPMNPPADMSNAQWSNLSSNIGQQYFWFGRIFGTDFKKDNLLWYFTNYAEPGTLDTSLIATDGNNNPNTMNSVFQLLPRLLVSFNAPMEKQSSDALKYMPRLDEPFDVDKDGDTDGPNDVQALSFTDDELAFLKYLGLPDTGLPAFGEGEMRSTPKILVDGADSIGARGALCRVYLNIGEFSEQWVRPELQNVMIGITPQKPFKMKDCAEESINWFVTMRRSTNLAKYFLVNSVPMRLEKAPGGAAHVKANDDPQVIRGAEVFARNCFVCHSSLYQPEGFWSDPADWKKWIQQPGYVEERAKWLVDLLMQPVEASDPKEDPFFEEFVKKNYLSTDARYHVSDIETNTGRSLADNAGSSDRMWADYSSFDFKEQVRLPSPITIADPYDPNKTRTWSLNTEAGPGRYRPPSLSSMWAHGPYLHNNSVGYYPYEWGPDPRYGHEGERISSFVDGIQSVDKRVAIFEDGARRLLGLESEPDANARRYRGFSRKPRRGYDSIQRTIVDSEIVLPKVVVGDLIYMQTLAFFGVGLPVWALRTLIVLALAFGLYLFVKGGRRLREGKGVSVRNIAAVCIGLVLVLGIISVWQKKHYRLGYIPKGTPVNLIANINGPDWILESSYRKRLLAKALIGFKKAKKDKVKSLDTVTVRGESLVDILIELSKCPDLIIDKGHTFGEFDTLERAKGNFVEVPEEDREALIEFLKKL